ncbi:MAG: hypothetical protein R8G66_31660 [Cytophagales bacterium]|nr:hypothetical protein [Cytophagales bacterium]
MDIDGVLLTKDMKAPAGASELIAFVSKNFNCLWLTTHCRTGANRAIEYLSQYYYDRDLSLLKSFSGADWIDSKTEAINWDKPFVWLEDYPFQFEIEQLKTHDCYDSLIKVNLDRQNEISNIVRKLKQLILESKG